MTRAKRIIGNLWWHANGFEKAWLVLGTLFLLITLFSGSLLAIAFAVVVIIIAVIHIDISVKKNNNW